MHFVYNFTRHTRSERAADLFRSNQAIHLYGAVQSTTPSLQLQAGDIVIVFVKGVGVEALVSATSVIHVNNNSEPHLQQMYNQRRFSATVKACFSPPLSLSYIAQHLNISKSSSRYLALARSFSASQRMVRRYGATTCSPIMRDLAPRVILLFQSNVIQHISATHISSKSLVVC